MGIAGIGAIGVCGLICLMLVTAMTCLASDTVVTTYTVTDFADSSEWRITSLHGRIGESRFENGVLSCDFSQSPGYIGIGGNPGHIVGTPESISIRFRSDRSGHPIVLRLQDSAWQFFQREIAVMDTEEERTVTVSLTDMSDWVYFGMPADGIVRLPLKLAEVIVSADGSDASLHLYDVNVTSSVPVRDGIVMRSTKRTRDGQAQVVGVDCINILPYPIDARYSWRVTDFFGKVLDSGNERLTLDADSRVRRSVKVDSDGVRMAEFELAADIPTGSDADSAKLLKKRTGEQPLAMSESVRVVNVRSTGVVGTALPERPNELKLDSPFGMGIYLGQRYPAAEMGLPARMARDIGVTWTREEFNWSQIQPERYRWRLDKHDAAVEIAQKHGISIMGLLCYWSSWTKPYTDEGVKDYCDYVRAVVGRYKDTIKHWEIWNEPNIFFWGGTDEHYADLLKAAYKTIKEIDPEAMVGACSTSHTDLKFIERILELGGYDNMDILTIHPYRAPATPEETDYIGELRRADELVRKYGGPKEIWITEIGWPTQETIHGSSETKQAAMVVRTYLQSIASGVVQKVFWYDFRNDGWDVTYGEHNFGLLRHDLNPKPGYVAFATMTRCIEGRKFVKALDAGKDVYAYLFEGDAGRSLALWCAKGDANITVYDAVRTLQITNLMGDEKRVELSGGRASFVVSGDPVFINGISTDVRAVATPLSAKDVKPIEVSVTPRGTSSFEVVIRSPQRFGDDNAVTVRVPGYVDSFRLRPGARSHTERYILPTGHRLDSDNSIPVYVMVDEDGVRVSKRSNLYYTPSPRVAGKIEIDGVLNEWPETPAMRISERRHVRELTSGCWSGVDDLSADIWTAWDRIGFYLAVRVRDDVFDQTYAGTDVWKGDSIQFSLDPQHTESPVWGDIFEFGLALTPDGPEVYCWSTADDRAPGLVKEARLAVKRDGSYTNYEAFIPLSVLSTLKPRVGQVIGFSLMVNDNDGDGRKGWVEWSGGIGSEKNPGLYGDLTLVAAPVQPKER